MILPLWNMWEMMIGYKSICYDSYDTLIIRYPGLIPLRPYQQVIKQCLSRKVDLRPCTIAFDRGIENLTVLHSIGNVADHLACSWERLLLAASIRIQIDRRNRVEVYWRVKFLPPNEWFSFMNRPDSRQAASRSTVQLIIWRSQITSTLVNPERP